MDMLDLFDKSLVHKTCNTCYYGCYGHYDGDDDGQWHCWMSSSNCEHFPCYCLTQQRMTTKKMRFDAMIDCCSLQSVKIIHENHCYCCCCYDDVHRVKNPTWVFHEKIYNCPPIYTFHVDKIYRVQSFDCCDVVVVVVVWKGVVVVDDDIVHLGQTMMAKERVKRKKVMEKKVMNGTTRIAVAVVDDDVVVLVVVDDDVEMRGVMRVSEERHVCG